MASLLGLHDEISFASISKLQAVGLSLSLSIMYVGSLYITPEKYGRDHPATIKHRSIRVTLASFLSCLVMYCASSNPSHETNGETYATFWRWIGVRAENFLVAVLSPLLLLFLLFLGPVIMLVFDQHFYRKSFNFKDIILWRNCFVAPLSEELVFRGCMLPILIPSFGSTTSIMLAPLFFGVAHIHHAYEQHKTGCYSVMQIFVATLFQASYTTVFGILSSFIFVRTGHLISVFTSHSFCNMMGFPDFELALHHKHKYLVCCSFVVGLFAFLFFLFPLTDPALFDNHLFRL